MNIKEILEDVISLDSNMIIPDELILSNNYTENEIFEDTNEFTKMRLSIIKKKISKIIRLNRLLNKFEYGYLDKETGKLINPKNGREFAKNYHYLSPKEFESVKGGVCWDYAEYQYRVLRKAGYQAINFYIELSDKMSSTHTFTVVKVDNYYIYTESSFQILEGVYISKHVSDIFNFVLNGIVLDGMMEDPNDKTLTYQIHSYFGYDNYGCTVLEFMDHMMTEKLVAKGSVNKKNPLPENLKIFQEDSYIYRIDEEFFENYVISGKDIYYNKDKFDSGEINLCFITGLSGSGKSTMAHKSEDVVTEVYELDDVVENWNFTDSNLKDYGDLIYSFFNGIGKGFRYRSKDDWWNDKTWDNKDPLTNGYEAMITKAFVKYAISYSQSHKDKRFIVEGIYIYSYIEPKQIDAYAVYIKGTSMLISKLRAAKRDSKDAGDNKVNRSKAFAKQFSSNWKFYICNEKKVDDYRKYFSKKMKDTDFLESVDIENEILLLEGAIEHSFLLKEVVEEKIFSVLGTAEGRKKYKHIQDEYINRNMEKLSTAGPMYLIVFGDNDQKAYFDLFEIKKEEIVEAMKKITQKAGANSDFKFLRQNPILVVLYFCIRYFTLEKDEQGVNTTLGIFSLGIYWSKFTKYFPKGVIGPVMDYTIDNMTEKFMVKKCGNIFNTLMKSINQSYQFHKKRFYEGGDDDVVAFLQRISNDQNSLLKKIANEYMKNYKEGNAVTTRNDEYDPDNPIVDDIQNASTIIQNQVSKVTLPIISNGVDLVLAEAAARMSKISISDCREYLTKIMVQSNLPMLESLIESILFMFIYTDKKTIRDIKSQYFLVWAVALFRKTNSKDSNLININKILENWAKESGIYSRYKGDGSRINYKKGIFFYVILSIQKYS